MTTLENVSQPVNKPSPPASEPNPVARLHDLETKRIRYEALADKLFTLPQKLRHPGLIPVGPRLYLPGHLTNTNRLTVLLGSCDDEAYFAERSAFQAQGIVQRRLALIDEKVKDVVVGEAHVQGLVDNLSKQNASTEPDEVPDTRVDTVGGKVAKVARRVSFRDPVVTHVHVAEGYRKKKKKGRKSASQANSSASVEQGRQTKKALTDTKITRGHTTAEPNPTIDAGAASPGETVTTKPFSAKEDVESNAHTREQLVPREEDTSSPRKAPTDEVTSKAQQDAVRTELKEAIRNAERQVLEQGVVNITEVFDENRDEPSRVELPAEFKPDSNINFEDDSEEFLDMTGGEKAQSGQQMWTDPTSRQEYWESVLAAEREADIENEKVEKEEGKRRLRKEEKDFGSGFAKGFFGAPRVKQVKQKAMSLDEVNGGSSKGADGVLDVSGPGAPSSDARMNSGERQRGASDLSGVIQSGTGTAVKERVVERRGTRRERRKGRGTRKASSESIESKGMPGTLFIPDVHPEEDGMGVVEHSVEGEDGRTLSRFREELERRRGGDFGE